MRNEKLSLCGLSCSCDYVTQAPGTKKHENVFNQGSQTQRKLPYNLDLEQPSKYATPGNISHKNIINMFMFFVSGAIITLNRGFTTPLYNGYNYYDRVFTWCVHTGMYCFLQITEFDAFVFDFVLNCLLQMSSQPDLTELGENDIFSVFVFA